MIRTPKKVPKFHQYKIQLQNQQSQLIQKRTHSPLKNHASSKCSNSVLASILNESKKNVEKFKGQKNAQIFSKKKSFIQVEKPRGDESVSVYEDEDAQKVKEKSSKLKVKSKPTIKMSIIDYFDEENEDEFEDVIKELKQQNKALKRSNKELENDAENRKELFDYLLSQIYDLKTVVAKLSSQQCKSTLLQNSLTSLALSKISNVQDKESKSMIAEDIYKKLRLFASSTFNK